MLKSIIAFFEENVLAADVKQDKEHGIKLAAAALLIEMMRMDDDLREDEQAMTLQLLQAKFNISAAETTQLIDLANQELANITDYHQFTRLINDNYEYAEKVHIIELLWQVAYADKNLDKDEEHLVRKIAELLYVSHTDYISSKLRTRDSLLD